VTLESPELALSIRQPWAWALAAGFKSHENRTWTAPNHVLGQVIALHASKTIEHAVVDEVKRMCFDMEPKLHTAAVVGIARLVDCVTTSDSPWFIGPYGFVFENAVQLPVPIPCKGSLGFFRLPKTTRAELEWALHNLREKVPT